MPRTRFVTLSEAAALIPDAATVAVNSSSGLLCPDALLRAVGERFAQCGHPQDLTTIHPIAAGDMYGIDGIDHIARPGLLARVIAGSLPSGPSSMESPAIWRMIHENEVEAYNIPSGLIFHQLREAAARRPGVLTQVGMDTFLDPRRQGGRMNERSRADIVQLVEFDGQEWLYLRALHPDVALIRATTADELGNLTFEREGAFLGAYDVALAAHNNGGVVIAQVERRVSAGTLPAQDVRVPSILVDAVVVVTDPMQTTQTDYDPAISGEVRVPSDSFELAEWSLQKVIARRAALELRDGEAVNLGFGISALVPRVLLEEGLDGAVTWVIEQGAVGGMPLQGFQFGCAANTQAIIPSPDQFSYFQGGGFDRCFLSFMQIDREGNINVSRLAARPHVTAGVGGFVDITANARNVVISGTYTAGARLDVVDGRLRIEREGRVRKFVNEVEHVTFSGRRARQTGQNVVAVTERCVLRLDADGWSVIEIAPGASLEEDVLAQCEFPLAVAPDLREMEARLFQPERMGLRLQGSDC